MVTDEASSRGNHPGEKVEICFQEVEVVLPFEHLLFPSIESTPCTSSHLDHSPAIRLDVTCGITGHHPGGTFLAMHRYDNNPLPHRPQRTLLIPTFITTPSLIHHQVA